MKSKYNLDAVYCRCLIRKWKFCTKIKELAGGRVTPSLLKCNEEGGEQKDKQKLGRLEMHAGMHDHEPGGGGREEGNQMSDWNSQLMSLMMNNDNDSMIRNDQGEDDDSDGIRVKANNDRGREEGAEDVNDHDDHDNLVSDDQGEEGGWKDDVVNKDTQNEDGEREDVDEVMTDDGESEEGMNRTMISDDQGREDAGKGKGKIKDCVSTALPGASKPVTLLDMGFTMSSTTSGTVTGSFLPKKKCKRKRNFKVTDCDTNLHTSSDRKGIRKFLVPRKRLIGAKLELVVDDRK